MSLLSNLLLVRPLSVMARNRASRGDEAIQLDRRGALRAPRDDNEEIAQTTVPFSVAQRAFVVAGAMLLGTLAPVSSAQIAAGDAFPDLQAVALAGGKLPATNGNIVLVDFWASWCAPCKASFPAFARLDQTYRSQGLVIVAVSVDESEQAYSKFVKKWQPSFPALLDREQKLVKAVKVPTMPTSYLLGRDGRVRFVHSGFHGAETEALLREHIETLLKEKS